MLAILINLLTPDYYISHTTILPVGDQGAGGTLNNLAAALPGLDLRGFEAEPLSSSRLFPEYLQSDLICKKVISTKLPERLSTRLDMTIIADLWNVANDQIAMAALREATSIHRNKKTGLLKLTFQCNDRELSQFVAAEYIRQLESYCSNERFARLYRNREFLAQRLRETEQRLQAAENNLRVFRERNRNYNSGSSPKLQSEHEVLLRKATQTAEVYSFLYQQLELATFEAKRQRPVVAVLDDANLPRFKAGPARIANIFQATFAGMLLISAFLIIMDYLRRHLSPPDLAELDQLGGQLRNRVSCLSGKLKLRRRAEV